MCLQAENAYDLPPRVIGSQNIIPRVSNPARGKIKNYQCKKC